MFKVKSVTRILIGIISILVLGNIVVNLLSMYYSTNEYKIVQILYQALDFNEELNIPTYFNSMLHFLNCVILFVIGKLDDKSRKRYWYLMSLLFCFTALDEMLRIHDRLNDPLREFFDASGALYFTWIIPYSIVVLILGALFFQFLRKLSKKTFLYFLGSVVIFLSGAIGIEVLEASHYEVFGGYTSTYFIMYTVEETLEMLGLCLFCYGLMDYVTEITGEVKIGLT